MRVIWNGDKYIALEDDSRLSKIEDGFARYDGEKVEVVLKDTREDDLKLAIDHLDFRVGAFERKYKELSKLLTKLIGINRIPMGDAVSIEKLLYTQLDEEEIKNAFLVCETLADKEYE